MITLAVICKSIKIIGKKPKINKYKQVTFIPSINLQEFSKLSYNVSKYILLIKS